MPKAHLRNGELTVPLSEDIQRQLDLREGDELEAHIFPGSVVFRTTSADVRAKAWQRIFSVIDQVHPTAQQAANPIDHVEEEIVAAVKEDRRARRRP